MAAPAGDRRRRIGAFALSEPNAGTDAANQQTTAVRSGDGYAITGRKVWVANAEAAQVAIVFACTRPGLRGAGRHRVSRADGYARHHAHGARRFARRARPRLHGSRFRRRTSATTRCSARSIRDSGSRCGRSQGGRVAIAAQALGIGEAALDEAIAHAKTREQFGQPIANYQAIQWMLADIGDRARRGAAADVEGGGREGSPGAQHARGVDGEAGGVRSRAPAADKAMQILASAGYRRGSVVERLFRDVRATEIYQGTSEAQRMIIAETVLGDRTIG